MNLVFGRNGWKQVHVPKTSDTLVVVLSELSISFRTSWTISGLSACLKTWPLKNVKEHHQI